MTKRFTFLLLSCVLFIFTGKAQTTELWGNIVSSDNWSGTSDLGVYTFPASADNFQFTAKKKKISMNVVAGTYAGNTQYYMTGTDYGGFYMGNWYADDTSDDWRTISSGDFYDAGKAASDLTYDAKTGTIYGIFNKGMEISSIDFNTFSTTKLTTIYRDPIVAIATNKDGKLYWLDQQGYLYYWNTDYGFGFAQSKGKVNVTPSSKAQSMAFDQATGTLYWAASLEDGNNGLYTIDTDNATATKIVDFPNNEQVVSLYIPSPEADNDAPAKPTALLATFEGASTTGKVTFTLPNTTYGGTALTGALSYSIKVNDEEKATGTANPGATVTADITTAEGMATIAVTASNDKGTSPAVSTRLWIGYDKPTTPSRPKLAVDQTTGLATLTWTAPAEGQNGGYIDTDNLTYTVTRMPEAQVVAEGLKETTFTETLPDTTLTSYNYAVVAVNGTQRSGAAVSPSVVYGRPFTVPYSENFLTDAGFDLYTVIDVGHDYNTWNWNRAGEVRCQNSYYYGNDDYLVTPPVQLDNDRQYTVSYRYKNGDDTQAQRLAVTYGPNGDEPEEFTETLQPLTEVTNTDYTSYEKTIRVTTSGAYRIAFHCTSEANFYYLALDNIRIEAGALLSSPDSVTRLKATPGAKGALSATISFHAPQVTIGGDRISTLSRIDVQRGSTLVGSASDVASGQELSFTDEHPSAGPNTYTVTPYGADGSAGQAAKVSVYVGNDVPLPPTNISIADNGDGTATITWDDVPETGKNGGYVDPAGITYNVYTSDRTLLDEGLTQNTYTVSGLQQPDQQTSLIYRISAVNSLGESDMQRTNMLLLGKPFTLPFAESFAHGQASYDWFVESMGSPYSFRSTTLKSSDDDLGATSWEAYAAGEHAYLNSGKISAAGAKNPTLSFAYYATPGHPVSLEVYRNDAGRSEQRLDSISFLADTGEEGWRHAAYPLTGADSLSYIYLRFHAIAGEAAVPVILDDIRVFDQVALDVAATIQGPTRATDGREAAYNVHLANNGSNTASPVKVTLYVNGEAKSVLDDISLPSMTQQDTTLTYTPNTADGDAMKVWAVAEADGDADLDNNATDTLDVLLFHTDYPTVSNFTAAPDGGASLSWTLPELKSEPVTDGFDTYSPWSTSHVGDWTLTDGDGFTTFGIYDVEFPHKMEPYAFIVFNPAQAGIDTAEDEQMQPHSGDQFLACFDADPEEPKNVGDVRNDDWLISPELDGSAQTISFYCRNFDSESVETYEICASSTDTNPSSFTTLESLRGTSKWLQVEADVPEGTKYFAVHVTSRNKFAFFLDDATYTPAKPVIRGIAIYRDGKPVATVPADATTFTDVTAEDGSHTYTATVIYDKGESAQSAPVSVVTGIHGLANGAASTTLPSDIYSATGVLVKHNATSLHGLPAGVYVVNGKKIIIK